MYRTLSRLGAAMPLLLASMTASATGGLCFYADYNYQGAEWCPTTLEGNVTGAVVDKISAVRVPDGSKVTLYQHPDFTGKVLEVTADTPNLSNVAFNNLASSFRVDGATAAPAPTTSGTCFYENYQYQGASFCTDAATGDIVSGPVVDKISSVRIPAGSRVMLYQHPGRGGLALEITADAPNLTDLQFNNLTSSFDVLPLVTPPTPTPARNVLFVGNSFTHGEFEPAYHFNAANVTDLNGSGMGGVPGIFKQMTVDAGLSYDVSIEAVSGQTLAYHYQNRLPLIGSKAWDVVVLQEYSTLNPSAPLNPASFLKYSALLEGYVHAVGPHPNPAASVYVLENWARADQLYAAGGVWKGKTLEQAVALLHDNYQMALDTNAGLAGMLPVGDGFVAAVSQGVADRNPYDGIDEGKVDPWNVDGYHASAFSSTMEAFIAFGRITGRDPRSLGSNDAAAAGMGLTPAQATAAESLAWQVLAQNPVKSL
ncbi:MULTISPECIES: beta/gamma crystallin-related protein [Luteibacter]|uniref:beta/gamma crystallin-related protein n=1 Tax=Luteibacter TaxID=242605 RepID=UPI00068F65A3|nr:MULTISPECIES: beta/gamma crystallin-related protein [unclassified Luteibacter]